MATYTSNYQLHQWVPEDDFLRTDFNTDFQKIDTALAGLQDGVELKCRAVEEALPSPTWAEDPEEVPAAVRLVVPAVAWISADSSDSDRRKRAKP